MRPWFAILALTFIGCGEGENVCEQAEAVRAVAMDEVCMEKGDDCCVCQCWRTARQDVELNDPCSCKALNPAANCDGVDLDQARDCVNDETTCRQRIQDGVNTNCPS